MGFRNLRCGFDSCRRHERGGKGQVPCLPAGTPVECKRNYMLRTRYIRTDTTPSLKGRILTFFDLETNGLEHTTEILEIAGFRIAADELMKGVFQGEEFHSFIRFNGQINPSAYAVHKIDSRTLLEKGRELSIVLKDFSEFSQGSILVGHNIVNFDIPILNHHCTQNSILLSSRGVLDTCLIAREQLELPRYRLSNLAEYYQVENRPSHRALDDVKSTVAVFFHLMKDHF